MHGSQNKRAISVSFLAAMNISGLTYAIEKLFTIANIPMWIQTSGFRI